MSILIKGIKMPDSCDNCWALDDYGDYPRCRITEEQRGYNFPIREKRMDKCPLASVSPHGRLIDADELAQRFNDAIDRAEKDKTDYCNAFMYHGDLCTEWWCVNGMLEKAPTIIPAEEVQE